MFDPVRSTWQAEMAVAATMPARSGAGVDHLALPDLPPSRPAGSTDEAAGYEHAQPRRRLGERPSAIAVSIQRASLPNPRWTQPQTQAKWY